jgi:hypothetical protein
MQPWLSELESLLFYESTDIVDGDLSLDVGLPVPGEEPTPTST